MIRNRNHHGPFGQRRLSRRRALQGAALGSASLAAVGAIACRAEQAPRAQPESAVRQPKQGGIVTHAGGEAGSFDTRGTGFDPHVVSATQAKVTRLFYQGLLAYDLTTYEVEPELAQKWEQPSPTEYLFSLQSGVKWQNRPPLNGRPLTAHDAVFSLERARTNEPRFFSRSLLTPVDKIEAVETARIKITTKEPDATILSILSSDMMLILAPEIIEKVGSGRLTSPDLVVGTGAFIMKSVEENVGGEYVRNPDYWKPGRPYLDGLRTQHFDDEQTAWATFLAGRLDIARVPGTEAKRYIAQQGPDFTPLWFKDDGVNNMMQPNTKVKPLDDPRVTRALRLLLDHDEFKTAWAEVWFGRGQHASIFGIALDGWDLTEEEYSQHIEWKQPKDEAVRQALSLLNAAGFSRDNPLKFELATQSSRFIVACTELVQAQWRRLSQGVVDAQIRVYDTATSNTVRANRAFTYYLGGNSGGTTDPDSWLNQIYRTGGSRNYTGFSDPKLDEMIDKQRAIFDLRQRKAYVKDIVRYMLDHYPGVIPTNRLTLSAVSPRVRDYAPEFFLNGRQYEWVWLDA